MKRALQLQAAGHKVMFWLASLLLAAAALAPGLSFAQTAAQKNFDHLKTGFALTGSHAQTRCESCHQNGIFKGTPRDCASCHVSGMRFARGNLVMPQQHLQTQQSCDTCHTTKTFVGARFNHTGVVPGTCASCHNGNASAGKPRDHIPTSASCDTCHRTTAWSPAANFDHSGVVPGTCQTCHGAGKATGKPTQHMPTNAGQSCDDCHKTFSGWRPTAWNHTQMPVTAQCATCHSGGYPPADGRPGNHIPYASIAAAASANCDTCHKGSTTTWANGRFHNNVAVTGSCASCHTGSFMSAVGKPGTPVHNGVTNCESCHNTAGWAGAKVEHSAFNASTNCASCHNGSTATAKPAGHMPTGATACFSCHNVSPAGWKPTKWTHTQMVVSGQCASCHTGGYLPADGRPSNHIPYQSVAVSAGANCDSCHKGTYTTWGNGRYHANYLVSSGCATCHTGAYLQAVGKPNNATHASVTGNCESCHKSSSTWSGAQTDHSTFTAATNCASCHGVTATGKSATHIPVGSTNCASCHNVSPALWTPSKWNHTQVAVTAQCASCHTGGYLPADGRPANHIPYQTVAVSAAANCDSCHKGSTTTWANGRFHSNYSVSTGCASCHTGAYLQAVGKPNNATHASVTGNCESCHKSTGTWSGAQTDHSTFTAATNCASCHGVTATGKPATHIPVGSTNCASCHNVSPALWTPSKWNHTQVAVTAQCASCHTGGYPPADGRPSNHIPYQTVAVSAAANCDACHKGSTTTWANGRFHSNYSVSTGCASCHTGAYLTAVGKPNNTTHAAVTGNCESCHKSTSTWGGAKVDHSSFTVATNCSTCHNGSTAGRAKPANHIPHGAASCMSCHNVSPAQWTPTTWNHTQVAVAAQCATCHTGGYPPADGRPANHIPYQAVPVTAAANCDACHKGSTTTWGNGRLHANFALSTGCASCHTGAYLQAVGKPNNTTHATVTGNCESCHKSTSTWSGAKVDHSTFTVATNCSTCHNGSTAGRAKPANHIPHGTTSCMSCHNVSPAQWTPTKWNHTQVVVTAQCASCHTGGYPPADGRPTNHIPYQAVPVTAAANCDGCHKGSTTTWGNGRLHANYSLSTNCASCHTGAYLQAVGKPNNATHATVTGSCESCHKSTTSWNTVTFAHSAANAVGTGTCDTCHNGSSATGKSATHIPVTGGVAKCDSCHRSQASFATAVTMNHTVVATMTCKTCHNGSFVSEGTQGALAKPTNHIPEVQLLNGAAMDCKACHTTTTSWGTMTMNHNASQGNGAGWCKACHQSGTSFLGSMEKKSLTHNKSTGVTDCSQSGCHRPLGTKGTAYRNWD